MGARIVIGLMLLSSIVSIGCNDGFERTTTARGTEIQLVPDPPRIPPPPNSGETKKEK